jgi:tight adherence protein C
MTPILVSLIVLCMAGVAATAVYHALYGSHRALEERFADLALKVRAAQGVFEDDEEDIHGLSRLILQWAAKRVPVPKPDTPEGEKLARTLIQAGYLKSTMPQMFQVIRLGCGALGGLIGAVVGIVVHDSASVLLFALAGFGVGIFVPSYYVGRRARQRQNAIARQLSDVLDLLVVCVEAGLGLFEAIKVVGTESERQQQEIGRELALVTSEISAGATLGQALRNLAERTAVEDIRPLAATLIQSEQLGAQIAPALHASSDALRTRRRLRAEEAAQRTTIKILFPLVLFVLPAMLLVIVGPAIIQIMHTLGGAGG